MFSTDPSVKVTVCLGTVTAFDRNPWKVPEKIHTMGLSQR